MKTKTLYMNDSYRKEMTAQILEVKEDGPQIYRLLLDQTVFYPMGGGQPTDQGKLQVGDHTDDIYMVMMKDGDIWHYIKTKTPPKIGDEVRATINWDRRYKNMKIHSAGHVVDFAMYLLGYSPNKLKPFKGDHGKKPYIVYQGTLDEDVKVKLENKSNELVQKNLEFVTEFQNFENLQKEAIYLQPGLPTNKPLRTLRLETVGSVADGGTQVMKTSEIGKIQITNIEQKEGSTIVYYQATS